MSNRSSTPSGGIGICGAVFIVFLILKLIDKIDWSWWWVTCPLWGPIALVFAIGAIALAFVGVIGLIQLIFK